MTANEFVLYTRLHQFHLWCKNCGAWREEDDQSACCQRSQRSYQSTLYHIQSISRTVELYTIGVDEVESNPA